jgi:hypothetical protein
VANKIDCLSLDARQRVLQQGKIGDNVWHTAASSHGSVADSAAVGTFLRFVEHLNDSRSV